MCILSRSVKAYRLMHPIFGAPNLVLVDIAYLHQI